MTYAARYRDRSGEEFTSILNDGRLLSVTIRGVEFQGYDFDALEPSVGSDADTVSSFTLQQNALCSCVIDVEIPVPIATPFGVIEGELATHLELGDPTPNGGISRELLSLRLGFADRFLTSMGSTGWFEDELSDLQRQMPDGMYIKTCYFCAFADYYPAGHGLFGGLACFRDNKSGYRSVHTKRDLFGIWDTMTEFVQETFLCPEFEKRLPSTGYRG